MQFILVHGLPGSGKSSGIQDYAEQHCLHSHRSQQDVPSLIFINLDDIRAMMYQSKITQLKYSHRNEYRVQTIGLFILSEFYHHDITVIFEDSCIVHNYLMRILRFCEKKISDIHIVHIDNEKAKLYNDQRSFSERIIESEYVKLEKMDQKNHMQNKMEIQELCKKYQWCRYVVHNKEELTALLETIVD